MDLSLIPTEDLITALKARFDYIIFHGVQTRGQGIRANDHLTAWHGHVTMCAGMAVDLIREMQDWAMNSADESDEEGGDQP